jgi:hypothetical protein
MPSQYATQDSVTNPEEVPTNIRRVDEQHAAAQHEHRAHDEVDDCAGIGDRPMIPRCQLTSHLVAASRMKGSPTDSTASGCVRPIGAGWRRPARLLLGHGWSSNRAGVLPRSSLGEPRPTRVLAEEKSRRRSGLVPSADPGVASTCVGCPTTIASSDRRHCVYQLATCVWRLQIISAGALR